MSFVYCEFLHYQYTKLHRQITLANKKTFFQGTLEIYTYSEAEWCPKHDGAFSLSLN